MVPQPCRSARPVAPLTTVQESRAGAVMRGSRRPSCGRDASVPGMRARVRAKRVPITRRGPGPSSMRARASATRVSFSLTRVPVASTRTRVQVTGSRVRATPVPVAKTEERVDDVGAGMLRDWRARREDGRARRRRRCRDAARLACPSRRRRSASTTSVQGCCATGVPVAKTEERVDDVGARIPKTDAVIPKSDVRMGCACPSPCAGPCHSMTFMSSSAGGPRGRNKPSSSARVGVRVGGESVLASVAHEDGGVSARVTRTGGVAMEGRMGGAALATKLAGSAGLVSAHHAVSCVRARRRPSFSARVVASRGGRRRGARPAGAARHAAHEYGQPPGSRSHRRSREHEECHKDSGCFRPSRRGQPGSTRPSRLLSRVHGNGPTGNSSRLAARPPCRMCSRGHARCCKPGRSPCSPRDRTHRRPRPPPWPGSSERPGARARSCRSIHRPAGP
jgi:hypothetical protein